MKYRLIEKTEEFSSAFTARSSSLDLGGNGCDSVSLVTVADVNTSSAKTFDSGGAAVDTATFDTKANTDPGDYLVIYDTLGLGWAIAADITGTDPEPTGAVWAAIAAGRKAQVDLSNVLIVTAANVATAFQDAFNALTAVPFEGNDSTATVIFTQDLYGLTTAPETYNEDDSGAGSITAVVTDAGVDSEVSVGASQVTTLTFAAKDDTGPSDFVVIYDVRGEPWAVYADTTGTDEEPTGSAWQDTPAAQRGVADISGATTAASVAAIFETAFDALTSVPFATDDTAADGTMLVTMTARGPADEAGVFDAGGLGTGSIAEVLTTGGAYSQSTIPDHGLPLGAKGRMTTTGTLPTGLTTGVDYFVIPLDEDHIAWATTLVNAQAGLALNMTTQGSDEAVNTFTPTALAGGSIKLQQSNDNVNWVDLGSATTITADATVLLEKDWPTTRYVSALVSLTAGHISASLEWLGKGDRDV